MSGLVNCPAPPKLIARQFPEPDGGKERAVIRIVAAHRIPALQPGIVPEPLDLRQLKPGRCVSEQPRRDALTAVRPGDAQVADTGRSAVPGQPLALVESLHF